jgi:HMG-box domain
MAGMKESTQARQRKEERRQAFYRSMTERAQKERTSKGTEAGAPGGVIGLVAKKKGRDNAFQESNHVSNPSTTTTNTTIVTPALNKNVTPISAYGPQGYAALPRLGLGGHQQANHHCAGTMDQSVFEVQMRLQAQEQALAAVAAATANPASHLYNSSFLSQQRQNTTALAAAHNLQQQERQQLLMAHRRELLEQRQRARAMAASQAVAAGRLDSQQQHEEKEQETAASAAPRADRARSALALLMQQQRRIQDLEQQLALAASPSLAPAAAPTAVAVAAADSAAPMVVDLVDDEDEDNEDQGTTTSSHSSLASSQGKQQPKRVGGPVPPLSAYALFLKDEWTKIMKHAKANNRGVNPNILVQAIATKWKALDQSILIRYAVFASQDKERYQRECAAQASYQLQQQQQQQLAQYSRSSQKITSRGAH